MIPEVREAGIGAGANLGDRYEHILPGLALRWHRDAGDTRAYSSSPTNVAEGLCMRPSGVA